MADDFCKFAEGLAGYRWLLPMGGFFYDFITGADFFGWDDAGTFI